MLHSHLNSEFCCTHPHVPNLDLGGDEEAVPEPPDESLSKWIQSEKMANLGRLLTGVSHEINNPVNFISGNLNYADRYMQDLIQLVEMYRSAFPEATPEIQTQIQQMDLEFVLDDFPKIQVSMQMGADRLREIVQSLRLVSHSDDQVQQSTDVEDCLESTLVILNHRLKAVGERPAIQVQKNYDELPLIDCNTGQINQVLMNILSNAIDAVEGSWREGCKGEDFVPQIVIKTELGGPDQIVIRIEDNGCGMSPEVQAQIMRPFFTTKAPSQGTGIGLAITQQLIQEHQGELYCESTLGERTIFTIQLPINR